MTRSAAPPGRAPQAAAERADIESSQRLDSPIPPTPQARQRLDDLALPDVAQAIEQAHNTAHAAARSAIESAIRCGELLLAARRQVGHGGWLPWVEANLSFGDRQARKYMRIAAKGGQIGLENSDLTIDGALTLLATPNGEHTLRVMGSSESADWFTPAPIVERVAAALGQIDLDPCWHPESPVRAAVAYTVDDDGLAQRWAGRLYLNPPYGREIDAWISRLVAEYDAGAVSEAIALVPARVDTEWFRRLDPFPRCFVSGRLTFANAEHPAPFPSAVVYLGPNLDRFVEVFGPVGRIFVSVEQPTIFNFEQVPPGRPRADLPKLDELGQAFLGLSAVERNQFSRRILEYQIQQTDLTPRQKARLSKPLAALTDYSEAVAEHTGRAGR